MAVCKDCIYVEACHEFVKGFIVDTDGTAFDYELLGKRFFLTREEAERALKEREKNGQGTDDRESD